MFKNPDLNTSQPTAATMVVIPQEEWLNLHEKLDRLAELITNRNADDRNSERIESDAARKMLGISPKTWQNYRDQRGILFSQIGSKIYDNHADLDALFAGSNFIRDNNLHFSQSQQFIGSRLCWICFTTYLTLNSHIFHCHFNYFS